MHVTDLDEVPVVKRALPSVAVMWLIFALSSRSVLPALPGLIPDVTSVAGHVSIYAALAATLWWALPTRTPPVRRVVAAFVGSVVYGASDEWHQAFVPGRDPSLLDLVADAAGAAFALSMVPLLHGARKRRTA